MSCAWNSITRRSSNTRFNTTASAVSIGRTHTRWQSDAMKKTHTGTRAGKKKNQKKKASKERQCHHNEPMGCPACETGSVDDVVGTVAMATELLQRLKWMSWQRAEEWREESGGEPIAVTHRRRSDGLPSCAFFFFLFYSLCVSRERH